MSAAETKTVLVLYVGGTIGMKKNEDGVFVPTPDVFLNRLRSIPQLYDSDLACKLHLPHYQLILPQVDNAIIIYELIEYDQLLDSSNMTTTDWIKIAKDVKDNYKKYDGFVILHGTDTLAYTSSALSFMFSGLEKTIIVTGAQISIFESCSDAVNNILTSLILATYCIPEVCVVFANKLLRGNRATKVRPEEFDGFDSPNYGILGSIGVDITIYRDRILNPDNSNFALNTNLNNKVGILTFFPTITASLIENFLEPLDGVVIQSYGMGNIPSNQEDIVNVLQKAVKREIIIVNTTICPQGSVAGIYETGQFLQNIGIVSGRDMTLEAALTKLAVVLGDPNLCYKERVMVLKKNIRGELTPA